MFECTSCDYIGSLFIEIDPEDYKEDNNSHEGDMNNEWIHWKIMVVLILFKKK